MSKQILARKEEKIEQDNPDHLRKEIGKQIPAPIRRLQKYREDLKNRKLRPSFVQWLCTDRCRFHCHHCGTQAQKASPDELTTREIIKAIDDLQALGCEVFSITGGDPLLRDDLFEVLGCAKRKGIKIGLTTHAYNTEKFLPRIEKAGLDSIMVSIDGYRRHHDRIRDKPGAYEKCLHSIRFYYHIGIPVIGVSVIVMDENVRDIPKIIDDVYAYGGNRLRIQPLLAGNKKRNIPQAVKNAFRLVFEARQKGFDIEISEGFGYLGRLENEVRSSRFFCGCGWDTFTIMPNGNVMGCPALNLSQYTEGNIKEDDLRRIWFERFERFRGDIAEELHQDCKTCQHLQICRGGCWLFRAYGKDPCFLPQAEEVAAQIDD